MNEAALVIGALLIACVLYGVFLLGRVDGKADLKKAVYDSNQRLIKSKADLVTMTSVRHNLNCLIGEINHELNESKADALAFKSLKGKWVTDNKHLVEYHIRKECFRRIGYPEERL